ncbi:MAG: peptidoglycan bridge formation glycyltransferase FemA/FemB family protein [Anaerolineales bacterium]|nr:peptidoglycan bridge formation glycyltransferase FemA/FemB family protein [Anaerolineales bacterium]
MLAEIHDNPDYQSPLKIEPITDPRTWNDLIRSLPNHHVLQSWEWGDFKKRYGWVPQRLVFVQGEGRVAAAAQVLARWARPAPVSVLYVPKGPVLDYSDRMLCGLVLDALAAFARKKRAIFIKIDPDVVKGTGVKEILDPAMEGPVVIRELETRGWRFSNDQIQFRNTVQLDLKQSEETLLAAMKQKTRYNIRLAERRGVEIRPGSTADLPSLFDMYAETAERDQFLIRPLVYYRDAWAAFMDAGLAHAIIAESEGQTIAAIILFCFGDRVWYMYGASRNVQREKMPNHLLQWAAIRWARNQGYSIYDMWGAPNEFVESDPMWGVWRFKAGFGGEVIRHIGAWDKVISRPWNWFYTVAIPFYLAVGRSFGKRKSVN